MADGQLAPTSPCSVPRSACFEAKLGARSSDSASDPHHHPRTPVARSLTAHRAAPLSAAEQRAMVARGQAAPRGRNPWKVTHLSPLPRLAPFLTLLSPKVTQPKCFRLLAFAFGGAGACPRAASSPLRTRVPPRAPRSRGLSGGPCPPSAPHMPLTHAPSDSPPRATDATLPLSPSPITQPTRPRLRSEGRVCIESHLRTGLRLLSLSTLARTHRGSPGSPEHQQPCRR